jgi:hypothetical protein
MFKKKQSIISYDDKNIDVFAPQGNRVHSWHRDKGFDLVETNSEYHFFCKDCGQNNHNSVSKPEFTYKFNNYKFRSDDFFIEDASENYLFSGCSHTFGLGLPIETTWGYQVNQSLNGKKFLNLAVSGSSYKQIFLNIYKYLNLFDKPKAIFLLLPDLNRYDYIDTISKVKFLKTSYFISSSLYSKSEELLKMLNYETLFFNFINEIVVLEMYCKKLGIPLYWSTWNERLYSEIISFKQNHHESNIILNNFVYWDESCYPDQNNTLFNKKYKLYARDKEHFGTIAHEFFYNCFLKRIKDEKNNQ